MCVRPIIGRAEDGNRWIEKKGIIVRTRYEQFPFGFRNVLRPAKNTIDH